ncbi:hypothetical protein FKR81_42815 [Lentzea tibetensis]|uniref:Uncharacterized protein n=1 Tax=Lentzea tibetensis TaxID=2591470 RepID=A0A563EEY2_9PSEU|nr:hypothetical protein FKR81_42815 [Lentzea tibetensis]
MGSVSRPWGRLTDHNGLGVLSARFDRDLLEEVLNRSARTAVVELIRVVNAPRPVRERLPGYRQRGERLAAHSTRPRS